MYREDRQTNSLSKARATTQSTPSLTSTQQARPTPSEGTEQNHPQLNPFQAAASRQRAFRPLATHHQQNRAPQSRAVSWTTMRWPYTQQAALHTAGETNIFTLARLLVASVIGGLKAIHRWPQALPWCHDKLESSPPASPAMDPPSPLDSRDSLAVWLLQSR